MKNRALDAPSVPARGVAAGDAYLTVDRPMLGWKDAIRSNAGRCRVQNPFIIGERLYLRPLSNEDAALYHKWANDVDVRKFFDIPGPRPLHRIEQHVGGSSQLAVVVKAQDRFVGYTLFSQHDSQARHAMYAVLIGEKDCWGCGYATEVTRLMLEYAFQTLNFNKVWLRVHATNKAAVKAYQKCGFKTEGVLREDKFADGRFHDSLLMSVLRREWAQEDSTNGC